MRIISYPAPYGYLVNARQPQNYPTEPTCYS